MGRLPLVLCACLAACSEDDGDPACESGYSPDEYGQMVCNDETTVGNDSGVDPGADSDQDGMPDADEAVHGTDPKNPD